MIAIEKNVPLIGTALHGNTKYPFQMMKSGDSFLFPAEINDNAARSAGTSRRKRYPSENYVVARVNGGRIRCWRVA